MNRTIRANTTVADPFDLPFFQRALVAALIYDTSSAAVLLDIVKQEHFTNPVIGDLFKIISEFFSKYGRTPTEDELAEEVNVYLRTCETRFLSAPEDEYYEMVIDVMKIGHEAATKEDFFKPIKDKVVAFVQVQEAEKIIRTATEHRDYEAMAAGLQKAMLIGTDLKDMGLFLRADFEKHITERREKLNRAQLGIPTGYPTIDRWLGSSGDPGGICAPEVGIIMAPTKRGKTTVAINFAKHALLEGHNVVHYSFESNHRANTELWHASITGIERSQLTEREQEVRERWQKFFSKETGEVVVKHFFAGGTPQMIENHINQLKIIRNMKPSLIIVDYLGLMMPSDKRFVSAERYITLGQITLELIALAQRHNIAVWLLHQSTRASKGKYLISTEDAADSQEVMRHADIILTINQTPEEAGDDDTRQIIRIYAAGCRNAPDGWVVPFIYNKRTAQIWESGTTSLREATSNE